MDVEGKKLSLDRSVVDNICDLILPPESRRELAVDISRPDNSTSSGESHRELAVDISRPENSTSSGEVFIHVYEGMIGKVTTTFREKLHYANHRMTTNIQRRFYGQSTDAEIRPLDEEKAVQAASDLIGELFVFSVAGTVLIFEVQRSARSEARKEETRRQEIEAMKQKEVEELKQKVVEIERLAKARSCTRSQQISSTCLI
ncbi:OPA3-like protein [Canna indica]|uniref:OPA3-like protein n=1 Tax=Canna indica TaxID=4628 RepID=A0AAQ3K8N2_9LILI|nr:OPA3-like protein [Canna indica]